MTVRTFVVCTFACGAILAGSLAAQNAASSAPENLDITGIPAPRGIFYHAANGWMSLSSTVLMPFWDGKHWTLEVLNVGRDHTTTQLPGRHADLQIANDPRPVFYLHDVNPSDLYLVRATEKGDYREVEMRLSHDFWDWAHFREKDITDWAITGVNGDVVAIRPTADLKPGEYTLALVAGRDYRWLRLGFDFGVASVSARR